MLDKYKNGQASMYKIITNSCDTNRLSHAYLIDVNNNKDALSIVIDFVKYIVCPYKFDKNKKCSDVNCKICDYIDNNVYSSLKIIRADGMWIKKEQLLELQREFSMMSLDNSKKIYIIDGAEQMNLSAANTMLKFLEEPEDDILAFLLTNNTNLILNTIKSRCQFIKLNSNEIFCDDLKNIDMIISFVDYLEKNGVDTLLYYKMNFSDLFNNREDLLLLIDTMIYLYKNSLMFLLKKEMSLNEKFKVIISNIVNNNTLIELLDKINFLVVARDDVKFNVNISLFVDNLIIKFGGEL